MDRRHTDGENIDNSLMDVPSEPQYYQVHTSHLSFVSPQFHVNNLCATFMLPQCLISNLKENFPLLLLTVICEMLFFFGTVLI